LLACMRAPALAESASFAHHGIQIVDMLKMHILNS
jgi:hypothetical protein